MIVSLVDMNGVAGLTGWQRAFGNTLGIERNDTSLLCNVKLIQTLFCVFSAIFFSCIWCNFQMKDITPTCQNKNTKSLYSKTLCCHRRWDVGNMFARSCGDHTAPSQLLSKSVVPLTKYSIHPLRSWHFNNKSRERTHNKRSAALALIAENLLKNSSINPNCSMKGACFQHTRH